MRVLQTIQSMNLKSGGPTTCTRDLMNVLGSSGETIDLLTFKDSDDLSQIAGWNSSWLKIVENDTITPLRISKNFRHALDQSDYDLYHCNALWLYSNHMTCKIAREKGRPYVLSPHGMLYPTALALKRWKKLPMLYAWFNKDIMKSTCIHATCIEEMEHCRAFGYRGPIAVIPNPVVFPKSIEIKKQIDEEPAIGFLGRFHPIKKVENLLKGANIALRRGCRKFRIYLIGAGDKQYESFIHEEVRRLKLEESVQFLGYITGKEKYEWLSKFRALFVPSVQENFGMIVPEALICGTPVYASLGTPWQELNEVGCGWWRDNSPETIADIIDVVMSISDEELLSMGYRGHALMKDKYEQHKVASMMIDLYKWILGCGPKPSYVYD